MCPMKTTTKIRFTEPQIALVMRAYPNCNLDRFTELCFEFDQAGKIIDCIGTIKDGGSIDHDYSGSGLARLYEAARRRLTGRQTSATIVQFPNGERPNVLILVAPGHQAPYQADRPRCARDIRGRIGLALDCRSGPGPRTARCRARSSSDQGAARLNRR
jgi:hypothetical protein